MKNLIYILVLIFTLICPAHSTQAQLLPNRGMFNRTYNHTPIYRVKFVWWNGNVYWYQGPVTRQQFQYWNLEGKVVGYTFYYVRIY